MVSPSGHSPSGFPSWTLSISLARTTVPPPVAVGQVASVVGGPNDLLVWLESQLGLHAPSDASQRLPALCAAAAAAIAQGGSSLAIAIGYRQHPYAVAGRRVLRNHRAVMTSRTGCVAKAGEYVVKVTAYAEALSGYVAASGADVASLPPDATYIHFPPAAFIVPIVNGGTTGATAA